MIYRKMDQMIISDAVVVPLWYDMAIHFVQPGIKGFVPNSLNLLELRRVQKE
jgi:peptide/nickel transport system substrate-binding protein